MKPATPLIKGVLEKLALLEGVGKETVSELALQSSVVRAARGEVVVRRGERVPSVYAVACGAVKARLARPHGGENVLALLGPGATFGKTAVLLARPSLVDLVALEDTTLVATRAACIVALVERNLRFSRNLARALAERNQNLLGELEAGRMPSAQRLAAYLDSIAQPEGRGAHLPISKTLLAARLGMKKETLSRLLKVFAGRGLIMVSGRDIAIRDAARLRQLAATDLTAGVQGRASGN